MSVSTPRMYGGRDFLIDFVSHSVFITLLSHHYDDLLGSVLRLWAIRYDIGSMLREAILYEAYGIGSMQVWR